jgi:hypothetical protein
MVDRLPIRALESVRLAGEYDRSMLGALPSGSTIGAATPNGTPMADTLRRPDRRDQGDRAAYGLDRIDRMRRIEINLEHPVNPVQTRHVERRMP